MPKQLRNKTITNILDELQARISSTPLNLDEWMIKSAVQRAIRKMNEICNNVRCVLFEKMTSSRVDVTELDIDEVATIYTSGNLGGGGGFLNNILPELGDIGLPLILGAGGMKFVNLSGIVDYLIIRTNLNILMRKLGKSKLDWELYNIGDKQILQFSQAYANVLVFYWPYLNEENNSWDLWPREYEFVVEFAWKEICKRSNESLMAATPLGVNSEARQLYDIYTKEQDDLVKAYNDSGLITYVG